MHRDQGEQGGDRNVDLESTYVVGMISPSPEAMSTMMIGMTILTMSSTPPATRPAFPR